MAKNKREKVEGFDPKTYKAMRLGYAILSFISIVVVIVAFYITGYSLYGAQQAMTYTAEVQENLEIVNSSVTKIVLYQSDIETEMDVIHDSFERIDQIKGEFDDIKILDTVSIDNFNDAVNSLDDYHEYLQNFKVKYQALKSAPDALKDFSESIPSLYKEEVSPLQSDATDKIKGFVDYQAQASMEVFFSTAQSILIVLAILVLVFSIGITATRFMEASAYKAALKIRERSDEVVDLSEKAIRLREKAKDIAYINILTGLRNRYGLEEDVEKRIQVENVGFALFDYDNFKSINELYGREFGDEFVSIIADKLKTQCGQFADIYNLSGDEFCFVFKQNVSATQIINYTNVIFDILSKPCVIRNVTTSVTVSGCSYLCKAGECASIDSVLLKMDGKIRDAKTNGGDKVFSVNESVSL